MLVVIKLLITGNVRLISDTWWQKDVTASLPTVFFIAPFLIQLLISLHVMLFQ